MQNIYCSGGSHLLRYFLVNRWLFSLKLIFQSMVASCTVFSRWSGSRLLHRLLRKLGSPGDITCLLLLALVLSASTHMLFLLFDHPRAPLHPQVRPTAQYSYSALLSPQYWWLFAMELQLSISLSLLWIYGLNSTQLKNFFSRIKQSNPLIKSDQTIYIK